MTLRRFFRTPKGLLLLLLGLLVVVAGFGAGFRQVAPGLVAAIAAAVVVDAPILRWRHPRWVFPDGALLTALIVAMILSPQEPWYVAAVTSAIAVLSKYVFRVHAANVFNPAAFALVATFYWFDTGQSWWGALPDVAPAAIVLLFATGLIITDRVNKITAVLAFLGGYFLLCSLSTFLGNPAGVAELFRTPDLQAALFFAFFMVTDPPTSPPDPRQQVVFGLIVAVASYAVFELVGAAYYLLAGLLVGNIWESARRWRARGTRVARRFQAAADTL